MDDLAQIKADIDKYQSAHFNEVIKIEITRAAEEAGGYVQQILTLLTPRAQVHADKNDTFYVLVDDLTPAEAVAELKKSDPNLFRDFGANQAPRNDKESNTTKADYLGRHKYNQGGLYVVSNSPLDRRELRKTKI